ncbi:MAG: peptide chain release factor aRF-1 [Nanoarchaeota archaeon]|nr:peptide chain release factor aRF-1 [Nanoarchaeota archaeon]MBU1269579.1 peptide chain release factor aRF-1 [Nanoarchaeota archaeon]MBU1604689.1 peptide chain release factor aRF-1 [Nanoarchaeota archaeon]MBU2443840.1 peptide chain release factor aRF-1 [Nanoarchaeota archaeon]
MSEDKLTAKQRFKLKHFIKELEQPRGRHTELISVYIPAGYDMNKITNHLFQEQGTASNIKSKATKDNVITGLEKMMQHLKLYSKTPKNGLAVFSGNVSEREGQQDFKVWSIEPPVPLKQRLYRCDKEFVVEPLREQIDDVNAYGLVVLDKREGNVALLKGKTIIPLKKAQSAVPGKTRAGGQSSKRFERLREGAAKEFFKKMADMMKEEFLMNQELKGIIVGGPGHTKNEFVDGNYITDQLKQKIIALKDLSYTGEFGLQELLDKSDDVLSEEEVIEEKKLMQKFFNLLAKQPGMVNYGLEQVMDDIKMGVVEIVMLSEELDDNTIAEFEKEAEKLGSEVMMISTDTREGVQLRDLGKVAAILRYEVQR